MFLLTLIGVRSLRKECSVVRLCKDELGQSVGNIFLIQYAYRCSYLCTAGAELGYSLGNLFYINYAYKCSYLVFGMCNDYVLI